jgi:hypothetical protein
MNYLSRFGQYISGKDKRNKFDLNQSMQLSNNNNNANNLNLSM